MRTLLLAFLLVARCALAQLDDVAFVGSLTVATAPPADTFSPTNIAGYQAYSWYVVEGNYSSASGLATLTNLSALLTNAAVLNLTNRASGTTKQPTLQSAALDSKSALYFDGTDDYLRSDNYTSATPHEVVMMLVSTNHSASATYIFDSMNGSFYHRVYTAPAQYTARVVGSAAVSRGITITNQWYLLDMVFNGSSSKLFTNNVQAGTDLNLAVGGMGGFSMAAFEAANSFGNHRVLEMVTFQTNLSTAARDNLYNYFKTNYPSASMP